MKQKGDMVYCKVIILCLELINFFFYSEKSYLILIKEKYGFSSANCFPQHNSICASGKALVPQPPWQGCILYQNFL